MKIAPRASEAYIARPEPGHHAVLLYGPDAGLVATRARRLADAVLGGDADPMARADLPEARLLDDPALLADELSAVSLMAPRRALIIGDASDKLARLLEDAAPHFNAAAFLIVCAGELSPRSPLRGWFEKAPNAAALPCYHDEAADVQALLRQALSAAGIEAGRDVVEYVTGQLGNDRGVTMREIDKLTTYAGDSGKLSLDEAMALVDYNRDTGFDALSAAVADRSLAALEPTLTRLLRDGASPMGYLRALQKYFNRLYYIRAHMQAGKSVDQVIQGLRPPVFFRQVPVLTRHAQQWEISSIVKALTLLAQAELACKTSDLPLVPASSRKLFQVTQLR